MNYVTLINKNNLIRDNYFKYVEIVEYTNNSNMMFKIEKETLNAYLKLKEFLESINIFIDINFAYKDSKDEYHTGLAIDIFVKNDMFLEVHKYLNKFGFILRYPKDKEIMTGYSYEKSHIRYVGVVPATIIYNNGLCLEEYINDYSGVLVVNKEKGVTSRDVVNEVSNILGIKKIGHTGTLDPLAEGVLVLTIGKATKIGELLTSYEKEYVAGVKMGVLTDTLDVEGKILKEEDPPKIDLNKLIKSFRKTYMQEVPIYSAVKVSGKKLYEYARNNLQVELPKKEITVKKIELLTSDEKNFSFKCLVSKGTYIRSLIRDMGIEVNNSFTMSSLIRTKQGDFSIDDAYKLEDIENNRFKIISIEEVLLMYPTIDMDDLLLKKVINGCKIENIYNIEDKVLFKYNNKLIAIYEKSNDLLKIWKMIINL